MAWLTWLCMSRHPPMKDVSLKPASQRLSVHPDCWATGSKATSVPDSQQDWGIGNVRCSTPCGECRSHACFKSRSWNQLRVAESLFSVAVLLASRAVLFMRRCGKRPDHKNGISDAAITLRVDFPYE